MVRGEELDGTAMNERRAYSTLGPVSATVMWMFRLARLPTHCEVISTVWRKYRTQQTLLKNILVDTNLKV